MALFTGMVSLVSGFEGLDRILGADRRRTGNGKNNGDISVVSHIRLRSGLHSGLRQSGDRFAMCLLLTCVDACPSVVLRKLCWGWSRCPIHAMKPHEWGTQYCSSPEGMAQVESGNEKESMLDSLGDARDFWGRWEAWFRPIKEFLCLSIRGVGRAFRG